MNDNTTIEFTFDDESGQLEGATAENKILKELSDLNYDRVTKEDTKQNLLGCFAQLACCLAIIAIPLCMRTSKTSSTAQTEKVSTVVKDSVQNVAKDTLQLFK